MSTLWRALVVVVLLAGAMAITPLQQATAAGVVGNGTAGSCTEAALDTALTNGGAVTFNCGAAAVTIGLTSEKVIEDNTEIDGGGLVTLDGQNQTRIFSVNGVALELNNITLTRGNGVGAAQLGNGGAILNDGGIVTVTNSTFSNNSPDEDGGAILNRNGASLTVEDSLLTGNSTPASNGGAILNSGSSTTLISGSTLSFNTTDDGGAIYNNGTLTITDSTLNNNSTNRGGAITNLEGSVTIGAGTQLNANIAISDGGAIFSSEASSSLTITDSSLNGNSAGASGGGIYNSFGSVSLTNSTVSGNMAAVGGGLYNIDGNLMLTNSTVRGNSAALVGAGIYNNNILTVIDSTVSENSASISGGGIFHDHGSSTFVNSTVSGNSAGAGGGIYFNVSSIGILTNSTISGNSADTSGGGIFNFSATATLTNSTLSGNMAGNGGGILNDAGILSLQNTIVANSPTGANCAGTPPISQGGNLGDDDTCNLTELSDFSDTEDNLGPLADNGGPTQTHVPGTGSLAIDNAVAPGCPAEDQRGVSRPQGVACDIGAVEARQGATYPICASYYTGAVTSPRSGGCGPGAVELTVPGNLSFCINSWTGQLTYPFGRPCTPPRLTHTMPDDGDLLTCVSLYTGANRWVTSHGQCSAYELPNTIPSTP